MGEHLGADVGAQVAGDRIDGLVFLFNADVECGLHLLTLPRDRNWLVTAQFQLYSGWGFEARTIWSIGAVSPLDKLEVLGKARSNHGAPGR